MQNKQGRDGPSVPAMPEVAVQSDGGLGRPARWEGRLRLAAMQAAKTSGIVVLPVFSEAPSTNVPPPPPPDFPAPVTRYTPPTYLSTERPRPSSAGIQAPGVPSDLPTGLRLLFSPVPANPAGFRPDGPLPLGTDVTVRRPANGRWATPAIPGETNMR